MTPFIQYHSRYLGFRTALDVSQLLKHVEEDAAGLNNLFMAGLGMGTLFLRMGAVIQISEKLHDGDTSNDALFLKQVMDNLRETLPSDTNWKSLWYASLTPDSKWDKAIPRDGNKASMLDRFVTLRNKYVHQSIRLIPEHLKEIEKGIRILDEMASLFVLFETGEIVLQDERYYWNQEGNSLELSPFIQKGSQEGLPYLFQGLYENKSKAKFINTVYGDETHPDVNTPLEEKFEPIQQALRGGAGQSFDHSERIKYYLDCFVGREREVRSVLEWVNGESVNNVLPIYSEAGMGKGALTAGIIDSLLKDDIPVMYHYCGSGLANSLHAVLYHFILQGKKMPGMNGAGIWKVEDEFMQRKMDRLPSRYHEAIHLFQKLLDDYYNPPKKYLGKPLVIVIDGLDEAAVVNSQLKVSDWFYTYNDKDEPEDDWKSPGYIKWIFTYRSLPGNGKDGFRLEGHFSLEQNGLVQPMLGLTEDAVRAALNQYNLSQDFTTTLIERGRSDGNSIDPAYFKLILDSIRNSSTGDYEQITLPFGLSGLYEGRFQIQPISYRKIINCAFVTIAHLREPFSLELLEQINPKFHKYFLELFINDFSDLFSFVNSNTYQLNHDRLRIFLLQYNSIKFQYSNVDLLILNAVKQLIKNQKNELSNYSLKHLSKHLLFVGQIDVEDNRLFNIATDQLIFEKQYQELNTRIYSHGFINDALTLIYYRARKTKSVSEIMPTVITLFELKGVLEFKDLNALSSIAKLIIENKFELGLQNYSFWKSYVMKHVKNSGRNSPGEFIFLGLAYLTIKISRTNNLTDEKKSEYIWKLNQEFLSNTPDSNEFYSILGEDILNFFLFENESWILVEYFRIIKSYNFELNEIIHKISYKKNTAKYKEEIESLLSKAYDSDRIQEKVGKTWSEWEFQSVFYRAKEKLLRGSSENEVFGQDDLIELYWDLSNDGILQNLQFLDKVVSEFKVIGHRKALCERNLIINESCKEDGLESLRTYLTWPRFVSPDGEDYNLLIVQLIDYNLSLGNLKIVEILFRRIAIFPEFDLFVGNFEENCKTFTSDEVLIYGFELLNLYEEYSDLHENHLSYSNVYRCLVYRLIALKDFDNLYFFLRREIQNRKKHYLKRYTEDLVIMLLESNIKMGNLWDIIRFATEQEFDPALSNFLFIKFRLYVLLLIKDWRNEWIDEEDNTQESIATLFNSLCDFIDEYDLDLVQDHCYEEEILDMIFELLRRCLFIVENFSTVSAISIFYNLADKREIFLDYLAKFSSDMDIDLFEYKCVINDELDFKDLKAKFNNYKLLKSTGEANYLKEKVDASIEKSIGYVKKRRDFERYNTKFTADDFIKNIRNFESNDLRREALNRLAKYAPVSTIGDEFLFKVLPLYSKFDVTADLLLRKYHARMIIDGMGKLDRAKTEYYDLAFLVDSFMIQEIAEKEDFDVFISILNWSIADRLPDVNFFVDYVSDDFFKIVILLVNYKFGKIEEAQIKWFVENIDVARDDEGFVVEGFLYCVNNYNKKVAVKNEVERILKLADDRLVGFYVDEDSGEVYERTEHRVFVYFYLSFCFYALDEIQKTKDTFYSCLELSLDVDGESGQQWLEIVISVWKIMFGIDDLKSFISLASDSLNAGRLSSRISDGGLVN